MSQVGASSQLLGQLLGWLPVQVLSCDNVGRWSMSSLTASSSLVALLRDPPNGTLPLTQFCLSFCTAFETGKGLEFLSQGRLQLCQLAGHVLLECGIYIAGRTEDQLALSLSSIVDNSV